MNVEEIIKNYLKDNGYDGLFSEGDCGCLIDDLFPCGHALYKCKPGYKVPCDCGDHDFHVSQYKEASNEQA